MLFLSLGPALQVYTLLAVADNSVWHRCPVPTCRWGLGTAAVGDGEGSVGGCLAAAPYWWGRGCLCIIRTGRLQRKGVSLSCSSHVLLGHVHLSWHCCESVFPSPFIRLRGSAPQVVVLEMEMMEGAGTMHVWEPGRWRWRWQRLMPANV